MIKKIAASELKIGMYIQDLNCGWMDHPFARNFFKINDSKTLQKIQALNLTAVYIDTDKGLDLVDAPSREEANREQQTLVEQLAASTKVPKTHQKSFTEELSNGVQALREANLLIADMMQDARLGKKLELNKAGLVVERMARSLVRNPNVLTALTQIRDTDHYTFEHSVSACTLMVAFCHYLKVEPKIINSIGIGALLHDIGKVKIPNKILNKPGRLNDAEFKVMRSHVVHSKVILAQSTGVDEISMAVAAEHHERFDGSGYPNGLKGEQMSYYSQIAAIIDVYDAITSDRCYQKGLPPTESLRRLYEWSETQFNRELTLKFIRFIGVYPPGSIVELDSQQLALVLSRTQDPLKPQVRLVYNTAKGRLIQPQDIDLSDSDDAIKGYAQAETWGLSHQQLLKLLL